MRNGTQALGWLVTDNLIHQRPATKPLLEILSLYGLTLGTLLAHKKSAAALKDSENRLRNSQQMLQNVLETIPVRVFWKDRNYEYMGGNHLLVDTAPAWLRWKQSSAKPIMKCPGPDLRRKLYQRRSSNPVSGR